MTDTRPAFPYEIQLTGSRHMTIISMARDGRAYVWANGEILQIQDRTRSARAGGAMPLVIQAISIAMWLNRRLAVIEVVVSECESAR